jgi:hypothetical protein
MQVKYWMSMAGMSARVDAVGNVVDRSEGAELGLLPALLMGSHIDTVRNAGKYDGALGVLAVSTATALFQRFYGPHKLRRILTGESGHQFSQSPSAATAGGQVCGLQDESLIRTPNGNTNLLVCRGPAAGDLTGILAHRWRRPGLPSPLSASAFHNRQAT